MIPYTDAVYPSYLNLVAQQLPVHFPLDVTA